MGLWRVVFREGVTETVAADALRRECSSVLLVDLRVVVMWPREVVVRRLPARDVERVELVGDD